MSGAKTGALAGVKVGDTIVVRSAYATHRAAYRVTKVGRVWVTVLSGRRYRVSDGSSESGVWVATTLEQEAQDLAAYEALKRRMQMRQRITAELVADVLDERELESILESIETAKRMRAEEKKR